MPITYGEITQNGYNFAAIVAAIERLILLRSPIVPNQYPATFHGIVDALWDLGNILQGQLPTPPSANFGPQPPGWDSNTQSYLPGQTPGDGSWWFDTRQGRLFIAEGGEWYQANGAENFVHVADQPPPRETTGRLWFCTLDGRLYMWVDAVTSAGEPGWYEIGGGGGGGANTRFLNDLLDVDDTALVMDIPPLPDQSILMRDARVPAQQEGAWVASGRIDLGPY